MTKPLISVFISNYNHGRYLKKCFGGMLAQTYDNFEVVITDDGSTDGSPDIIRTYAESDQRFKTNYFPKNRGVREAFADSIHRTNGKYIFCAGSDDFVVNKDFFKKAVDALEADPRPAGFYGICGVYLAEKEKLINAMGTAEAEGYNTPLQCCEGFLKCRSVISTPSSLWRRDLFLDHGGGKMRELIDAMGPQADFYLNHELGFRYGIYYEKTLFACQRVYEAKTNYSANLDLWKTAERHAEMERRLRPTCPQYPDIEKDWMRWRAFWMMDTIQKSGVKV